MMRCLWTNESAKLFKMYLKCGHFAVCSLSFDYDED